MKNQEAIEAKKKEIEHYKGVLERTFPSRWHSQGRRHMEDLKEELKKLEEQD